jgi:hypothetical protein
MTATMSERTTERTTERLPWVCDNCHRETRATRKRCVECGTSRF